MREKRSDYFENSRRATYLQREYARRNPHEFKGYGENCWGFTAGDGPCASTAESRWKIHQCFGYTARGVPYGPDDGTIAPWAALASLPFEPEIALVRSTALPDALSGNREGRPATEWFQSDIDWQRF